LEVVVVQISSKFGVIETTKVEFRSFSTGFVFQVESETVVINDSLIKETVENWGFVSSRDSLPSKSADTVEFGKSEWDVG